MSKTLKHICIFCMFLLIGGRATAQVGEYRSDLAIGINGGINLSSVTFTPTIKTAYLIGECGGITIRYTCEKYFTAICAVQMEINWAQRGWKEVIEDGSNNTYQRVTNYLEIPFMFNMGWGREQRGVRFFIKQIRLWHLRRWRTRPEHENRALRPRRTLLLRLGRHLQQHQTGLFRSFGQLIHHRQAELSIRRAEDQMRRST